MFGLIRSAFFWQKGQQAYFVPLIFRINACPFHGSGGFMYSEKFIPSDSNADLMLIYSFLLLFALQSCAFWGFHVFCENYFGLSGSRKTMNKKFPSVIQIPS